MDNDSEEYTEHHSIYELFVKYNHLYFENKLGSVIVKWSYKMTLCAGLCYFHRASGLCIIKLSEPLLKFRPAIDLRNTLLHEMIHAYLFIITGSRDRNAHGPDFQALMAIINEEEKSNITIYHSFHDEVNYYRQHVWRCSGECRKKPPYYGWVKRSINRPPQKADYWYASHQLYCGGIFKKISEPEKPTKTKKNQKRYIKKTLKGSSHKEKLDQPRPGKGLGTLGEKPAFSLLRLEKIEDLCFVKARDAYIEVTSSAGKCIKSVTNQSPMAKNTVDAFYSLDNTKDEGYNNDVPNYILISD